MFGKLAKVGWLVALAAILVTASCAIPKVTMPTPDENLVRTEAVQTAMAQLTREALLAPSSNTNTSTPVPSTTPNMVVVTATSSMGSSSTGSGGTSGSSGSSSTFVPTWTPSVYIAQYVAWSQNPQDGYRCQSGDQIDVSWKLKNIGVVTWKRSEYYYHLLYNLEGNHSTDLRLTKNTLYYLPNDVDPGDTVTLVVDIMCPVSPPEPDQVAYTTQWELVNDNGAGFAKFFFRFYSVFHTEPSATPTITPSPG